MGTGEAGDWLGSEHLCEWSCDGCTEGLQVLQAKSAHLVAGLAAAIKERVPGTGEYEARYGTTPAHRRAEDVKVSGCM